MTNFWVDLLRARPNPNPTLEQKAALERAKAELFNAEDNCRSCGHYGPNLTHTAVLRDDNTLRALQCDECTELPDGERAFCWPITIDVEYRAVEAGGNALTAEKPHR